MGSLGCIAPLRATTRRLHAVTGAPPRRLVSIGSIALSPFSERWRLRASSHLHAAYIGDERLTRPRRIKRVIVGRSSIGRPRSCGRLDAPPWSRDFVPIEAQLYVPRRTAP